MAEDFELQFQGINAYRAKLQEMRDKYPYKEEEILVTLGQKLKASAKDKTPVGVSRKHLKNQYKLSKVIYTKDGSSITMTNTSPLFHLVEKGHTIKNEKNGKEYGFVQGQHMVETSMLELDAEIPLIVGAWLDEVLEDLK